jgi:hypothetical protein
MPHIHPSGGRHPLQICLAAIYHSSHIGHAHSPYIVWVRVLSEFSGHRHTVKTPKNRAKCVKSEEIRAKSDGF